MSPDEMAEVLNVDRATFHTELPKEDCNGGNEFKKIVREVQDDGA